MGPLSGDLRKRVVSAVHEEGMSCRAAARRFGVSFSSSIRWVAALRERGSYAPLPMGGDTRSQRLEAHADFLLGLHRREPDLTLNEICDRLELGRGEKVSASMIWRFFDRRDITFKKNPRTRASRTARTSLSGDGDGSRVNLTLDPLKLVFVDETAATTNMARRYGRRRRGQRLRCGVPHGHYKAITFVFGLRLRGVVAPKAYDHAMNAETFEAWLEHHLLPTLEEGDIVVLDNLKAHKSPRVAEILVRKNCTVRYLPPYSPDFNPIEMAISKLKSALRKLAERAVAGLIAILESCAGLFKPADCQSYFKACGYHPAELPALDTT
jgi:transposase